MSSPAGPTVTSRDAWPVGREDSSPYCLPRELSPGRPTASQLLGVQKKALDLGLGFDGQLPVLLLLKATVGAGESVHGGGGTRRGVGERVAGTGEEFPGVPTTTSTTASSATSSPNGATRAFVFCICQLLLLI